MIKIDGQIIDIGSYPDSTMLVKYVPTMKEYDYQEATIYWYYENDIETLALIYLVKHLRSHGIDDIRLYMPYIQNARMDRVKNEEDVFTLKYFAELINDLHFTSIDVLDPHSSVSEAIINNLHIIKPDKYINEALNKIGVEELNYISVDFQSKPKTKYTLTMFFPDEGAMKRYASKSRLPYAFGIKKRNWETGVIEGLDVAGEIDQIVGRDILIVDDICSKGGTFYHSAKKLKELGANKIYLYVTHCENTILEGELLTSGLVEKVYTTNSIFTKEHDMIEVFEL